MSLLELQQDFRAWLAEASDEAAERFGEAARPGLSVYQNNYRAALTACLSDTFERVRLWIGEDRFLSTAAAYIDVTPPHAWTLDAYAQGFPESLRALFPDDPEIAEIGWLDLALSEAFVGPDATPIGSEALGSVDWDHAVLQLAPTLRTAGFVTNAAAIWSALESGEAPPAIQCLAEPATLIVWRKDMVSCFRPAEPFELLSLDLARGGASFGAICAALVDRRGPEEGVADAAAMLGGWIRDGLIVGID